MHTDTRLQRSFWIGPAPLGVVLVTELPIQPHIEYNPSPMFFAP